MDPVEGLPPEPNRTPEPVTPRPDDRRDDRADDRRQKVVCEFCESHLTPFGHAMKLSDKARHYRDVDENYDKAKKKIADLERTIAELTTQLREAEKRRESRGLFAR